MKRTKHEDKHKRLQKEKSELKENNNNTIESFHLKDNFFECTCRRTKPKHFAFHNNETTIVKTKQQQQQQQQE